MNQYCNPKDENISPHLLGIIKFLPANRKPFSMTLSLQFLLLFLFRGRLASPPSRSTEFNHSELASTNSTRRCILLMPSYVSVSWNYNGLDITCKRKILNVLFVFFTFAHNTMVNWIHHHTKLPEYRYFPPKHPLYCNHKCVNTSCLLFCSFWFAIFTRVLTFVCLFVLFLFEAPEFAWWSIID